MGMRTHIRRHTRKHVLRQPLQYARQRRAEWQYALRFEGHSQTTITTVSDP